MTEPVAEATAADATSRWRGYAVWLGLYLLLAVILGAIASLAWVWGTRLPQYLVRDDGSATISERGLTEFFSSDAVFVLLGLGVGALLGFLGWRWLRGLGWGLPVLAAANALLAAVVCWGAGVIIGPGALRDRLEHAKPGDLVPIQHQLHAYSALAVWPFAAAMLILLLSALTADPEEGLPVEQPAPELPPPGPQGGLPPKATREPGARKPRFSGSPSLPSSFTSPSSLAKYPGQGPQIS